MIESVERREEAAIRILLIEDDNEFAARLGAGLTEAGYAVERPGNGADDYITKPAVVR